MSYSPRPGFIRTSGWGYRSSGFHSGVDYQARIGTPIRAADHGAVHAVRWHETYGNMVILQHGTPENPWFTSYSHTNGNRLPTVGARVSAGDIIGEVGNTGRRGWSRKGANMAEWTPPVFACAFALLLAGCAQPIATTIGSVDGKRAEFDHFVYLSGLACASENSPHRAAIGSSGCPPNGLRRLREFSRNARDRGR
jgi:Peptidase family M23